MDIKEDLILILIIFIIICLFVIGYYLKKMYLKQKLLDRKHYNNILLISQLKKDLIETKNSIDLLQNRLDKYRFRLNKVQKICNKLLCIIGCQFEEKEDDIMNDLDALDDILGESVQGLSTTANSAFINHAKNMAGIYKLRNHELHKLFNVRANAELEVLMPAIEKTINSIKQFEGKFNLVEIQQFCLENQQEKSIVLLSHNKTQLGQNYITDDEKAYFEQHILDYTKAKKVLSEKLQDDKLDLYCLDQKICDKLWSILVTKVELCDEVHNLCSTLILMQIKLGELDEAKISDFMKVMVKNRAILDNRSLPPINKPSNENVADQLNDSSVKEVNNADALPEENFTNISKLIPKVNTKTSDKMKLYLTNEEDELVRNTIKNCTTLARECNRLHIVLSRPIDFDSITKSTISTFNGFVLQVKNQNKTVESYVTLHELLTKVISKMS